MCVYLSQRETDGRSEEADGDDGDKSLLIREPTCSFTLINFLFFKILKFLFWVPYSMSKEILYFKGKKGKHNSGRLNILDGFSLLNLNKFSIQIQFTHSQFH